MYCYIFSIYPHFILLVQNASFVHSGVRGRVPDGGWGGTPTGLFSWELCSQTLASLWKGLTETLFLQNYRFAVVCFYH